MTYTNPDKVTFKISICKQYHNMPFQTKDKGSGNSEEKKHNKMKTHFVSDYQCNKVEFTISLRVKWRRHRTIIYCTAGHK